MTGPIPAISIGMPVYNGAEYLAEALDSVLAQTRQDWELILRDNASTDDTAAICRAYAARDPRLRYERAAQNEGGIRNHDRTFALARAPYFKWWAADDLCSPTFLARCAAALDADPGAAVAYTLAERIDERGAVIHRLEDYLSHGVWPDSPAGRYRMLWEELVYGAGATAPLYLYGLIRADVLRRTRLHGAYVASEWILDLELALAGQFIEIPEYLNHIRQHSRSSSMGATPRSYEAFYTPHAKGRWSRALSRVRQYPERAVAVVRAPLPLGEKTALLAYVAGTLIRGAGRSTQCLWRNVSGRAQG